jgi:pimeloyl-ACP methyl ester carboxylesterase
VDEPLYRRGYVDSPDGQLHYAEEGSGDPVVLLHQTPRSWDEYREVLPLLGRRFRAIAMDMLGFGASARPAEPISIEACGRSVVALLDGLGLERVDLVGHHTGGVVAVEVAARHPERVRGLVLSSTPYVDAERRERTAGRPPIDLVPERADGSHVTAQWQRRAGFYPPDRPDLLRRFVVDALSHGDRVEEGHHAVGRYRMEDTLPKVTAPTLIIAASGDPYAFPEHPRLADLLHAEIVVIDGGMVPLPDQLPKPFADAVSGFLAGLPSR